MTPKWISKLPKFVQLRANRKVDGHVKPAQHRGEVEFYSIYLGQPGYYQWVADFANSADARNTTNKLALAFNCGIDRSQYDTVMGTPAPEPQPKGHPHAALMAEYAKDAAETNRPWERWEASVDANQSWVTCIGHPNWQVSYSFRRKSEPPKTITVNGFKVPAPLDKVQVGTTVYLANPASADLCDELEYGSWYSHYFDCKIVHPNKEAAVAHAKAMLGIDPKESS